MRVKIIVPSFRRILGVRYLENSHDHDGRDKRTFLFELVIRHLHWLSATMGALVIRHEEYTANRVLIYPNYHGTTMVYHE
jgi:hypothetical protein